MRIRWRGLELPSRVVRDEAVSTDSYGRFFVEPFEQGFGTTVGNSLRRVLLSSLEGAAITTVKIEGVAHEFASIDGITEDVTDIVLNIKGIVLRMDGDEAKTLTIQRDTVGEATAGDIVCDASVSVLNLDHVIATLTQDVAFKLEMTAAKGRGYATGSDNRNPEQELGVIAVDSIFSPVLRVRYHTQDMRVGQKTNYDRLILEIWTNGAVSPEDALVEAGLILRKHLSPIVMYSELGREVTTTTVSGLESLSTSEPAVNELLEQSVSALNLSVRASNCLEAAKIATIGELVDKTEADLLRFRSFGKTSLHEVQRKLADVGLQLGMRSDLPMPEVPMPNALIPDAPIPDAPISDAPISGPAEELTMPPSADPGEAASDDPSMSSSGPMEAFTMGD